MKLHNIVLIAVFASAACSAVVRDANTYRQEIRFLSHVAQVLAEEQIRQAEAAAVAGDIKRCEQLATPALTATVRVPYHAAMSLFLADLEENPGALPEVPETTTWCAVRAAAPAPEVTQ